MTNTEYLHTHITSKDWISIRTAVNVRVNNYFTEEKTEAVRRTDVLNFP